MIHVRKIKILLTVFILSISTNFLLAEVPTTVSTFNSIGLYWSPSGGAANKKVLVQFREKGTSTWRKGLSMKYNPIANTDLELTDYRGSIVMLKSGISYEIELSLEGTSETETITASTWSENFPISQTINVESSSNILNINNQHGSLNGYILYDGSNSTIDVNNNEDYCIDIYGSSHIIIRGLKLTGPRKHIIYIHGDNCHDIVIENCDMSNWGTIDGDGFGYNYQAGVYGNDESIERIVIQRNKIHDPRTDSNSLTEKHNGGAHPAGPQGIVFFDNNGNHVIRYNEIWSDYDHMYNDVIGGGSNASYRGFPGPDSDIYGNYFSHCWDDGIESEGGNRNVRIWGNYIDSTFIAIGNAATSIGPLYVWRNTVGRSYTPLPNWINVNHAAWIKMGYSTDAKWMTGHMYIFNNTVLQPNGEGHGGLGVTGNDKKYSNRYIKHCVSRNNIFHAKDSDNSISLHRGCEDNDFDYDLHNNRVPSNSESNGISGTPIYESGSGFNSSTMTAQFNLKSGTSGYDAGVAIPNFADSYEGSAPDMGAFEAGYAPLEYGVNATTVVK